MLCALLIVDFITLLFSVKTVRGRMWLEQLKIKNQIASNIDHAL